MHDVYGNNTRFDTLDYRFDDQGHTNFEALSPFYESEEMELAASLLEVGNKYELEQVIDDVIRKAASKVSAKVVPAMERPLKGLLKRAAIKVLSTTAGPTGKSISRDTRDCIGRMFGLELEGLSPEDQEFELARHLIRFAGGATKHAALSPGNTPVLPIAENAGTAADRRYSPGLAQESAVAEGFISDSGKWVHLDKRIIVKGVGKT